MHREHDEQHWGCSYMQTCVPGRRPTAVGCQEYVELGDNRLRITMVAVDTISSKSSEKDLEHSGQRCGRAVGIFS